MALFGGIGKKLGLGSAKDVLGEGIGGLVEDVGDFANQLLPAAGAVAGFALGGPTGAAIGSGLGTAAQGGRSTEDILINSALAFGAGSVAQGFGIQQAAPGAEGIGRFIPDTSGFSAFGMGPGTAAVPDELAFTQGTSGLEAASGGGIADFFGGLSTSDYLLGAGLGLGALGLAGALGGREEYSFEERPEPVGKDFAMTGRLRDGTIVQLNDPEQLKKYRQEIQTRPDPNDYIVPTSDIKLTGAEGGIASLMDGGEVTGPGTGTSDSVPARLSDGEFVLTAKAVRGAGGGDRDIGAARMYDMMAELEAQG